MHIFVSLENKEDTRDFGERMKSHIYYQRNLGKQTNAKTGIIDIRQRMQVITV